MSVEVRLGSLDDVDAALSVYETSNLVRRRGNWPLRAERVEEVTANLRKPDSWFLVGDAEGDTVAMALVLPCRRGPEPRDLEEELGGAGPVVPGTSFLDLIYVAPERWGEGIGGTMLDAVIKESDRRGCGRIYLWTHERENERALRLYLGHGFARTGVTGHDDAGEPVAEWRREG